MKHNRASTVQYSQLMSITNSIDPAIMNHSQQRQQSQQQEEEEEERNRLISKSSSISTDSSDDDDDIDDIETNLSNEEYRSTSISRRRHQRFSFCSCSCCTSCKNTCSSLAIYILCLIIIFPIIIYLLISWNHHNDHHHHNYNSYTVSSNDLTISNTFPTQLLFNSQNNNMYKKKKKTSVTTTATKSSKDQGRKSIYSLTDFQNEFSVTPYWEDVLSNYHVPIEALSALYYYNPQGEQKDNNANKLFNDESYGIRAPSGSVSVSLSSSSSSSSMNNQINTNNNHVDDNFIIPHLGPCYLPLKQKEMNVIQWDKLIQKDYNKQHSERNITYPLEYNKNTKIFNVIGSSSSSSSNSYDQQQSQQLQQNLNLENYCRPGFLIIGAGKCGTSSLYHYLTGHNRVVPSKQKQIHYFKYYFKRPMTWYLSHFYSTSDFLSSGALMTGEASPGYLPYPDVAKRIQVYMKQLAGNGRNQPVSMPKIITIVRNPLERSYSSYRYNYIYPNLERIKDEVKLAINRSRRSYHMGKGGHHHHHHHHSRKARIANSYQHSEMIQDIVSKNMTDDEILDEYFFSFEDLVKAEMKILVECLKEGGDGEVGAKRLYGSMSWAKPMFEKRVNSTSPWFHYGNKKGNQDYLPPLVTLDESCYGGRVSSTVPRRQWTELVAQYPKKVINVQNLHLVQSLVGRSLYSLPLEWWYELYPKKDLHLVCNEELKDHPSETMNQVSDFLGLPEFDFSDVVSEGMYNVGGNEGYDQATKWDTAQNESMSGDGIPISEELRKRYLLFVKPFNERLFELSETRCKW